MESRQRFHLILRSAAPSARQLRDRATSGPLVALTTHPPGPTGLTSETATPTQGNNYVYATAARALAGRHRWQLDHQTHANEANKAF